MCSEDGWLCPRCKHCHLEVVKCPGGAVRTSTFQCLHPHPAVRKCAAENVLTECKQYDARESDGCSD